MLKIFNKHLDSTSENLLSDLLNNINFIIENYDNKKKLSTIEAIIRINTKNIVEREIKNYDNDKKLLESKSKLIINLLEKQNSILTKNIENLEQTISKLKLEIQNNKFKVEFFDGFQEQWCK